MTDSDTKEPPRRGRWRDDPLSLFLAFAAVLLGGMYLLEQRDVTLLEEAGVRAQELGARTDLPGCTFASAGAQGLILLIACSSTAEQAAASASALPLQAKGFQSIVFVGSDKQLACEPGGSWPSGCIPRPLPSPTKP